MIRYSPKTARARARLLARYNDIDVYVEDAATQNMYVRLLSRILGAKHTLTSVIPLDGRKNVIEACARDQAQRARRRLYLIDGDLDLLNGVPAPKLKHLYRLNVYCSENLVATEHAAIQIAMEGLPSCSYDVAQKLLNLDILLERIPRQLLGLFVLYAVVQRLGLTIQTSGKPIHAFLEDPGDPYTLSAQRVFRRYREILAEILQHSTKRQYRRAKRAVCRSLARSPDVPGRYVSGKTYLLPVIELRLRRAASVQDSRRSLVVRLATHCEPNVDPGLVRALRRAVR